MATPIKANPPPPNNHRASMQVGSWYALRCPACLRYQFEEDSSAKLELRAGTSVLLMKTHGLSWAGGNLDLYGLVQDFQGSWGWINLETQDSQPVLGRTPEEGSWFVGGRYVLNV